MRYDLARILAETGLWLQGEAHKVWSGSILNILWWWSFIAVTLGGAFLALWCMAVVTWALLGGSA